MAISDKIARTLDTLKIDRKNILDFAREELGITLLPAQIFIFKLFYSIPLSNDKRINTIPIGDRFNERVIHEFSEVEFAHYLYASHRLNVSEVSTHLTFLEVVFVIGRRGTKTTMSSIITLYTIYLILLLENPHEYFGILEEDEIGVAIVSNNRDGADRQFRTIVKMVYKSSFFKKHLARDPSGGQLFLKSRRLISNNISQTSKMVNKGDLLISTFAANPNVRGASNIVTISDEFAHFLDSDVSSKKKPLDKLVFEALTPSTSGFIYEDGSPAGKNFFISSPNGKKGMLYSKYKTAMKLAEQGEKPNTLVINVPSHWVNHKLSHEVLKTFYNESERSFEQEFEAKFIAQVGGWLTNIKNKVLNCIDRSNNNIIQPGKPSYTYFLGIDFGIGSDGSAFSIAHYEPFTPEGFEPLEGEFVKKDNVIVVDYIGYILPQEGQLVTLDDIYSELNKLESHYIIQDGIYDQWSGGIFSQLLEEKGYNNLRKLPATQQTNSDQAKLFRQLISEGRLILPNKPDFQDELFRLNEAVSREGLIKVEDKEIHDDQYDSTSRAVWLAFNDRDSNQKGFQIKSHVMSSPKGASNFVGKKSSKPFKSSSVNIRKPRVLRR